MKGSALARPNHQFLKRQRELAKKKKKEEKRQRKLDEKISETSEEDTPSVEDVATPPED